MGQISYSCVTRLCSGDGCCFTLIKNQCDCSYCFPPFSGSCKHGLSSCFYQVISVISGCECLDLIFGFDVDTHIVCSWGCILPSFKQNLPSFNRCYCLHGVWILSRSFPWHLRVGICNEFFLQKKRWYLLEWVSLPTWCLETPCLSACDMRSLFRNIYASWETFSWSNQSLPALIKEVWFVKWYKLYKRGLL